MPLTLHNEGALVMKNRVIKFDTSDNVLIALTDLNQGEQITFSGKNYTLVSDIPAKHKFATEDLAIDADVIMYGVIVGRAVKPVRQGERLTTNNIQHQAAGFHQQSEGYRWAPPDVSRGKQQTFLGYRAAGAGLSSSIAPAPTCSPVTAVLDFQTEAELKGQEDFIPWKRGVSL